MTFANPIGSPGPGYLVQWDFGKRKAGLMNERDHWSARTLAAQALGKIDQATQGVVPPIHVTTTFIRDPDNQYRNGNVYGRPDNRTVREAEEIIAALEGAQAALVLGSGMSAAVAVFLALEIGRAHV